MQTNLSRINSPSLKKPPRSKQRLNPPLLTKVSASDEPAKYEPTIRPLPKTAFVGERKVPVSGHTAEFLPFVRIKKPEPRVFSRAVGRKTKIFRKSVMTFLGVTNVDIPRARSEDRWDAMMDKLLRKEGVTEDVNRDDPSASYHFTATLSKAWWDQKLTRYRDDWTARGEAVSRLIEREQALVKEEKESGTELTDPKVAKETLDTILSEYRQKQVDATKFEDPFLSPRWMAKAQRLEREYVMKYAGRVDENGKRDSWAKRQGLARKDDSLLGAVESDNDAQFFSQIAAMRRGRQPKGV
ncbi:hypothetical protein IL306_010200 [Fusarium sp. DS 682]|nr:hypothetical protein IL306_010200 [Fusarium sp. DS 682]